MTATRTALVTILFAVAVPGCVTHGVRVTAYLSHDLPFPTTAGDIAVVVGSDPDEPLLEAEVARKVEHLVRKHGFTLAAEDSAAYVLTCWVSIDDGFAATESEYAFRGSRFATTYVYSGRGHWGGVALGVPAVAYEVPQTTIYYKRFLGLTLYDRPRWTAATKENVGDAAIWTCTAESIGTSSDLRSLVNFLLAGAFEQFGVDTAQQLRIKYAVDDPDVLDIARAGRRHSVEATQPVVARPLSSPEDRDSDEPAKTPSP